MARSGTKRRQVALSLERSREERGEVKRSEAKISEAKRSEASEAQRSGGQAKRRGELAAQVRKRGSHDGPSGICPGARRPVDDEYDCCATEARSSAQVAHGDNGAFAAALAARPRRDEYADY